MGVRLVVCATCREGAGRRLAGVGAEVRFVDCLNACGRPVALAVTGEGRATYLFAGVDPEAQAGEVAAFLRLFEAAPAGEVTDARPAGDLRFCLIGRVPA
jgi:predicted metal-binding protein